jgi:hypothetical protein
MNSDEGNTIAGYQGKSSGCLNILNGVEYVLCSLPGEAYIKKIFRNFWEILGNIFVTHSFYNTYSSFLNSHNRMLHIQP